MRKVFFTIVLMSAIVFCGCRTGSYTTNSINRFGTETKVVLDNANFRVVKDVEVSYEVKNYRMKKEETMYGAYNALLRECKLTGSQAVINVSIEEIGSAKKSGKKQRQYIIARATVIEFIK